MILIPVKTLANAKQRLAHAFDQPTRTQLAQTMLADVLAAVSTFRQDDVALVTSDPFAIAVARDHGYEVIRDEANSSETDAIAMATEVYVSGGIACTLVIPGDIPLIDPADLKAIYEDAPDSGTLIVPSADKRGTNAVLRRPAALFPLRFGNDSFMPHLSAAVATNKSCVILSLPRIALDIDTLEDLRRLAQAPGGKKSQLLARELLQRQIVAEPDRDKAESTLASQP